MVHINKVPNKDLLQAGLDIMRASGMPLEKLPTRGRSMIYETPDQKTVRVRTCNDHVLVVLADSEDDKATLNIDGTDFVLIVMAETPRTVGNVIAYLVPTSVVADTARNTHREWLASNPNTKGNNRTWNIWFDDSGPSKANGFGKKWEKYRLPSPANSSPSTSVDTPVSQILSPSMKLGDVIAHAKRMIADAAGVSPEAIKISVDLD